MDGHARYTEVLDQIVDADLAAFDHIVGDILASLIGFDHAIPQSSDCRRLDILQFQPGCRASRARREVSQRTLPPASLLLERKGGRVIRQLSFGDQDAVEQLLLGLRAGLASLQE
jgi:hypothetical protein